MRGSWCGLVVLTGCGFDVSGSLPVDARPDELLPDTMPDEPADEAPPPMRVQGGLVAFYDFAEGSGTTVSDTAGVSDPQNLAILDPASCTWGPSLLTMVAPGDIATPAAAYRVITQVKQSNQVTLEAWVTPASATQNGTGGQPARIASLTVRNAGQHLISLGQENATWIAHLRTSSAAVDGQGNPALRAGTATTAEPTHLVVTANATERRFYVNGVSVSDTNGGLLDVWKDTFVLEFAGDPVQRNTWLGAMHLIAIYNTALTPDQVQTNFEAGPQ